MEYFEELSEFRLLCCRVCRACVTLKRIDTHLKGAPHFLDRTEVQKAAEWAKGLDVIRDDVELATLAMPEADHEPIGGLEPPREGGRRCTFESSCRFVGSSTKTCLHHLKTTHQSDPKIRAGRKKKGATEDDMPWRTGVYYQRFFIRGLRSDYFEVAQGRDLAADRRGEVVQQKDVEEFVHRFSERAAAIRARETENVDNPDEFVAPNPWLNRLGAARHLSALGEKKEMLRGLLTLEYDMGSKDPRRCDDAGLRLIHAAFARLKNQAKACTRPDVVSWSALFEVNRKDPTSERTRPFHFKRKPATEKRYTQVCLQLLSYIVRVMTIEEEDERPPFVLAERQLNAYRAMIETADLVLEARDEAGGDMEAPAVKTLMGQLEKDVMEMFMSALDHHPAAEYDNILVSFLMVLAIKADHGWEDFGSFTPKLSAIATMARLFIVKRADDERREAIEARERRGMTKKQAEADSPGHFELIADMTRRFMVMGGTMPMQFVFRLRNFGMGANQNAASRGSVSWDGNDIVFKGIRLNIIDIQSMLRVALGKAETLLYVELLFCDGFTEQTPEALGLPSIPWAEVTDDASSTAIGVSLVDALDRVTNDATKGHLARKVWSSDVLRRRFFQDEDNTTKPNEKAMYRYAKHIDDFLQLLLFLVHLSQGQAARAPELLTVRLRNTADGGIRNVFFDRGKIMIVTGNHKGYTRSEKEKVIHRFLPREIGTPLVYYVWLVLDFWESLQGNTGTVDSFPATVWGLQESADPFEREWCLDSDDEQEGVGARPAVGKRSVTGPRRLGPGPYWSSDRMARILRKHSAAGCGKKINISSWRHISVALTRRYLRGQGASTTGALLDEMDDEDDSDSDGEDDSPWDIQGGHRSLTAGLVYGRLLMEGAFETNERRLNFRIISEEWHRLLGFRSALSGMEGLTRPGHKRKNPSLHHEAMRSLQQTRWQTLRRVDTERVLKKLYGDTARFRGLQQRAVDAIMANKSPVLVVMGTGGGKSLCFMLPAASCSGGVTVVVVPLVSLLGDMVDRCRKLGIPCAEWKSDRAMGQVAIVFVTPESAMGKRFQDWLESMRVTAQLDRIVIDECHTVLEGSKRFRPRLREISQLGLIGVQMVYLTATLPPAREDDFIELINTRRDNMELLRARTRRKNVRYSVMAVEGKGEEAEEEGVMALLDRKLAEYAPPAKMIVYCQTVQGTESLANRLGCDGYHREVDTRDGKAQRLQAWSSGIGREAYGGGRVIVATNALGLGIDIPDIRVVVHAGMPRELADYAQQSGRAGRDGNPSEAIVLTRVRGRAVQESGTASTGLTSAEYVNGALCRRVVLDSVMDGYEGRSGCEADEQVCDICAAAPASDGEEEEAEAQGREHDLRLQETRARARGRVLQGERELSCFAKALEDHVRDGCRFCLGTEAASAHTTLGCVWAVEMGGEREEAVMLGRALQGHLRRRRGAERFGCCFDCFVPQEYCESWVANGSGGWQREKTGRCRYKEIMVGTVGYVLSVRGEEAVALFRRLGFQGDSSVREEVWDWMGKGRIWGVTEAINLCRVFTHMVEDIEE